VLDIYKPMQKTAVSDEKLIKVAKIASVIIALFSFAAAPLLQYAPEGIFQIIRIFTGFYNIPVIAVVLVGLFTKRVPGIAATIAIVFHIIAYGLLQFVIKVDINFLHIYAILFFIEVGIMLTIGYWKPLEKSWHYQHKDRVDMTPWAYALPTAITLFSGIVMLYVLFSPIGLVGGLSSLFWPVIIAVLISNIALCFISVKYWRSKYSERLHWNET
jgi:SSS family solute:Na+ symporter